MEAVYNNNVSKRILSNLEKLHTLTEEENRLGILKKEFNDRTEGREYSDLIKTEDAVHVYLLFMSDAFCPEPSDIEARAKKYGEPLARLNQRKMEFKEYNALLIDAKKWAQRRYNKNI